VRNPSPTGHQTSPGRHLRATAGPGGVTASSGIAWTVNRALRTYNQGGTMDGIGTAVKVAWRLTYALALCSLIWSIQTAPVWLT
jgi:hypothetical protein